MKKKKTYLDKYKLLHTIPNYNFQLFNKWKWNVPENDNKLWSEFLYRHKKYLIKLSSLRVSSQSLRGVSEVSLVTSYSKSFLFRFTLSLSLCCSFFFFKSEVENSILVDKSRSERAFTLDRHQCNNFVWFNAILSRCVWLIFLFVAGYKS